MMEVEPITLEGAWVRLEPLRPEHSGALAEVGCDEEVYRYLTAPLATHAEMQAFVERALDNLARGDELPFVTIDKEVGAVAGSTRYLDIRREHRAVEIGYTWLGRAWWRTRINSEAKYLLLRHAFETWGCQRVSLKTDGLNERSQRAIARLGAVREGVLRKHMILPSGRSRDTVYFSIIDDEWPAIKARMESELYGDNRLQ